MDSADPVRQLLEALARGQLSVEAAHRQLQHLSYEPIGNFARIDHQRQQRTGFPEVIWGPGKTPEQIAEILARMRPYYPCVMVTRISADVFAAVRSRLGGLHYFEVAQICSTAPILPPAYPGQVGLVCAGTADLPVAEEAAITLQLSGFAVERFWDVGVAGIHRLLSVRDRLETMQVLIVVAGMEGALPSVVAGLVSAAVIAVPTSIGYGANLGGLAPLLTMLNSCAPGIGVVNIDNGFGAAMLAAKMLRSLPQRAATGSM
ncbi:nickel pincer cofactor biosynthesis protein LarB [Parathermosynechococcus lividus]